MKYLLDDHWRRYLADRGLDETDFERAGMSLDAQGNLNIPIASKLGVPGQNLDGDDDDYVTKRLRKPVKGMKFKSPRDRQSEVYLPPLPADVWQYVTWNALLRANETVKYFTEGPPKALAGVKHGLAVAALPGVFNWLTNNGGVGGDKQSFPIDALHKLAPFADVKWGIIFDQEVNPQTWAAALRFARLLASWGAKPFIVKLACKHKCKGLDDYLVKHGRADFDKLERVATFEDIIERDVTASDVKKEPVEWTWYERIAIGMVNMLVGPMKTGKSTLLADLIARITRGEVLFDVDGRAKECVKPKPGRVAYFAGEDSHSRVVVPRLEAAQADLTRVKLINTTVPNRTTPDDDHHVVLPDDLRHYTARYTGYDLIVFDVIESYASERVDAQKTATVRHLIDRLKIFAERTGAAVVVVVHINRNADVKKAMQRIGGSYAAPASARSILFVGTHPEDLAKPKRERRVVVAAEEGNMLGDDVPALAFRLIPTETKSIARVAWDGAVDVTADAIIGSYDNAHTDSAPAADAARKFLEEFLKDEPRPATDATASGVAAGNSKTALERAAALICRRGVRDRKTGETTWVVADGAKMRVYKGKVSVWGLKRDKFTTANGDAAASRARIQPEA